VSSSNSSRTRAGSRALLSGVAAAALAALAAAPAGAVVPPNNGVGGLSSPPIHLINSFPVRDFVHTAGWVPDDRVTINVLRGPNDVEVGTATAVTPFFVPAKAGSPPEWDVDVNHPGAACWETTTPDLRPGDKIRATIVANASDPTRVGTADQIVSQNVTAGPAVETAPNSNVVVVHGTAETQDGQQYPDGQLESRLVAKKQLFNINGRREIRAITGAATGNDGLISYDQPGSTTNFNWTATFDLNDTFAHPNPSPSADTATAVGAESRGMWLGRNPAAANEVTAYEFAQIPGPAAPCTAPLAKTGITGTTRSFLNSGFFAGGQTVTVSGVATSDVTAVSVAGPGGPAHGANLSNGTWSADVPAADLAGLADGPVSLTATFTGGTVPTDSVTVTKDTVAPGAASATPGAGTYTSAQDVTLSTASGDGDSTVHFTVNGNTPTATSPPSTAQIHVTASQTIKAIVVDPAGNASPVSSFAYTIATPPPPPPPPGGGTTGGGTSGGGGTTGTGGGTTGGTPAAGASSGLPAPATIIVVSQAPTGAPATAAAPPALLALGGVSAPQRIGSARLRAHGLSVLVHLPAEARVVRLVVYRMRHGRKDATALSIGYRPTGGATTLRLRLSDRALLRKLRPGRYRLEITPGRSQADLGATAAVGFQITP
jgi:hypothetical protein